MRPGPHRIEQRRSPEPRFGRIGPGGIFFEKVRRQPSQPVPSTSPEQKPIPRDATRTNGEAPRHPPAQSSWPASCSRQAAYGASSWKRPGVGRPGGGGTEPHRSGRNELLARYHARHADSRGSALRAHMASAVACRITAAVRPRRARSRNRPELAVLRTDRGQRTQIRGSGGRPAAVPPLG